MRLATCLRFVVLFDDSHRFFLTLRVVLPLHVFFMFSLCSSRCLAGMLLVKVRMSIHAVGAAGFEPAHRTVVRKHWLPQCPTRRAPLRCGGLLLHVLPMCFFALLALCEILRCPLPCYRCSATVMILLSPSVVRLSCSLAFPFFWMSIQKDPPFSFQVLAGLVLALSVLRSLTRNCDPSAREQSTRQHLTGYTSFASSDRIDMFACWSFCLVLFLRSVFSSNLLFVFPILLERIQV